MLLNGEASVSYAIPSWGHSNTTLQHVHAGATFSKCLNNVIFPILVSSGAKAGGQGPKELTSAGGRPGLGRASVRVTPGGPSSGIMSAKPS